MPFACLNENGTWEWTIVNKSNKFVWRSAEFYETVFCYWNRDCRPRNSQQSHGIFNWVQVSGLRIYLWWQEPLIEEVRRAAAVQARERKTGSVSGNKKSPTGPKWPCFGSGQIQNFWLCLSVCGSVGHAILWCDNFWRALPNHPQCFCSMCETKRQVKFVCEGSRLNRPEKPLTDTKFLIWWKRCELDVLSVLCGVKTFLMHEKSYIFKKCEMQHLFITFTWNN